MFLLPALLGRWCNKKKQQQKRLCSNLAVIQMTEASDDFLLVELIGLELHPPHGLHGAIVLEALLTGQHRLHGGALLQTVHVAFLKRRTPKNITELHGHNPRRRGTPPMTTFCSCRCAWRNPSEFEVINSPRSKLCIPIWKQRKLNNAHTRLTKRLPLCQRWLREWSQHTCVTTRSPWSPVGIKRTVLNHSQTRENQPKTTHHILSPQTSPKR